MPNHVMNQVTFSGDRQEIAAMLKHIQNDKFGVGTIDFNKVIPMPESLRIEAGSRTDRGLKAYREFIEAYTLGSTMNMDKLCDARRLFVCHFSKTKSKAWRIHREARRQNA